MRPECEGSDKGDEKETKETKDAFANNKDFRRWFHQEYLKIEKIPGLLDNPDAKLNDGYQQWLGEGQPKINQVTRQRCIRC